MTYFADLSPYAYGHGSHPGVVHVGWLDGVHLFAKGTVDLRTIEKIKVLTTTPMELYRGHHLCEVCIEPPGLVRTTIPDRIVLDPNCSWVKWAKQRQGNGEIRVPYDGIIYAAPILIVHYIDEHGYLPPEQFLEAIEAAGY